MDRPGSDQDLSTPKGRRAAMIELCLRRQRPGTGSNLRALTEGELRIRWPDLSDVFGPIPWAVVGAVDTRLYISERATADLDVMISRANLPQAKERRSVAEWVRAKPQAAGGSEWQSPAGVRLDVVAGDELWCDAAPTQVAGNRDAPGLTVLALPYLALLQLPSARLQDRADISRMLGPADEKAVPSVGEAVRRWSPEDAADLEVLVKLG